MRAIILSDGRKRQVIRRTGMETLEKVKTMMVPTITTETST